jgi:hypothetical protein
MYPQEYATLVSDANAGTPQNFLCLKDTGHPPWTLDYSTTSKTNKEARIALLETAYSQAKGNTANLCGLILRATVYDPNVPPDSAAQ